MRVIGRFPASAPVLYRYNFFMNWIYRTGIFVGLAAVTVGGYYWMSDEEVQELSFQSAVVSQGSFINKVQSTGTLEPQELVDVGAQVTGEIREFGKDSQGRPIDYGSEVKAGQLLARIDDTIVELAIQRMEASVAQAEAQINSAKADISRSNAGITQAKAQEAKALRDLQRAKKLGVGEALSQMSYDEYVTTAETSAAAMESALANLQSSHASLAQAKAQLMGAQSQLASELRNREYTQIKTPVDGTVIVRQVNVGQTVVSNMSATTLFLVARDLTKMQIWASVNEVDIAKIKPNQLVRFSVDALPNERFEGKVNKVRPNATMSSNVVTYIVEIDIENKDRKLLPYMSANVDFIVREIHDVILVPDAAFDFTPPTELVDEQALAQFESMRDALRKERPEGKKDKSQRPVLLWTQLENGTLAPILVQRGESDGAQSIVTPYEGQSLALGAKLITGIRSSDSAKMEDKGDNNPFGMKRPERRKRGTGAPARP